MLEKIKSYVILCFSIVIAILYFLFLRKKEELMDLQREHLKEQLDKKLSDLKTINNTNTEEYNEAIKEYRKLRDKYRRLSDSYDSSSPNN